MKPRGLGTAAFLAALFFNQPVVASAAIDELANDPKWLRLVHYEADSASPTGWRSAIHSPGFFLSGDGGIEDPVSELDATLEAMRRAPSGSDLNQTPQCRFPARRIWLAQKLGREGGFPEVRCPGFEQWTRGGKVESVSIVFATGYLGNPASYYGHTLLKLNFDKASGRTNLQDATVNYGAIDTTNDDPFSYIVKGVIGGYEGGFSDIQFHFHEHNYGENELRDLWEYRLDLPQDAVDLVVSHAWEVLGQKYDYFFFRRNCAFRMAEIVEILDGVHLVPENRPWTVPQALLQRLAEHTYHGKPIVQHIERYPSRQSRLYESFSLLGARERAFVEKVVSGHTPLNEGALTLFRVSERHAVLDALLDYYQFIADTKARNAGSVHPVYAAALSLRYRLPPGNRQGGTDAPVPPHSSRPPSWVQLKWRSRSDGADSAVLRVRPAYYDALDSGSAHVPNAALSMGDLQLSIRNNRIRVDALDIVAIESVNPGVTGLPHDDGDAWRLKFGIAPLRPGCDACQVLRVQGDMGKGRQLGRHLFVAAYVGGALQESRKGYGHAFGRVTADAIMKFDSGLSMRIAREERLLVDARSRNEGFTMVETRLRLGARSDLRVSGVWGRERTMELGMGYYW